MGECSDGKDARGFGLADLGAARACAVRLRAAPPGRPAPSADDRYSLADGCFALRSESDRRRTSARSPAGYDRQLAPTAAAAEPFRMQATDLGSYLFYGPAPDFLARNLAQRRSRPPPAQQQRRLDRHRGRGRLPHRQRVRTGGTSRWARAAARHRGRGRRRQRAGYSTSSRRRGCADYPEVETNVTGAGRRPTRPTRRCRAWSRRHMHQMAFEFLGGQAPTAAALAPLRRSLRAQGLRGPRSPNGCGAVLENVLFGNQACHDPGGWPTFSGLAAPTSS